MNGSWYRLEASSRAPVLEPGLGAPIADAMWMLARQWQLGEFRGEDAARPIRVRYELERLPLSHAFADPDDVTITTAIPLPADPAPVEVYVEREQLTTGASSFAFAAEAGVHLLRHLRVAGVSAPTRRTIAAMFSAAPTEGLGPTATLLAARSPDGAAAYAAHTTLHELVPDDERDAAQEAVAAWAAWYESRLDEPSGATGDDDAPMWRDERLAYRFALGARKDGAPAMVLTADDHLGGDLEWHAFDIAARPLLALPSSPGETAAGEVFPSPVRYGGMPAPRWWTFEDTAVHFGGISSGPADLARMVVAEFASVYSNDWWMLPVPAKAGHLQRITALDVIDSFGGVHSVASTASLDVGPTPRAWKFGELTGDLSGLLDLAPWLLILDTSAGAAHGDPVEVVEFVRDERSNLGWAGEVAYEAVDGRRRRRMDEWRATEPAADTDDGDSTAWRYRLGGEGPPPLWVPLVPERPDPAHPAVVLRRARMREWDRLPDEIARLRGRILTPDRPFAIDEVELPRSGLTVSRSYQTTRDRQGRLRTWSGRRKRLGRGERSLGARYDRIET